MRGEIVGVWKETWREIWAPMAKHPEFGDDLFPDLYRELVPEPTPPAEPAPPQELTEDGQLVREEDIEAREIYECDFGIYQAQRSTYEEAVSGGDLSRKALRVGLKELITKEAAAVGAFEKAFGVVASYGDDAYANRYFGLVAAFLEKYSLRYDLRRPFTLHTTLPGLFARLMRDLKRTTDRDPDLQELMSEFEDAIRDLRDGRTPGRIKTCIQKQVNLLEALGARCPNVTENSLSQICEQVGSWPHPRLKEAMKKVYSFACDYPGIRHAGTPANRLREIDVRDLVAVTVLVAGFSPYLTDQLDSELIYGGE